MSQIAESAQKISDGERVRRERLAQDISARQLAYFVETSEATISRLERGLQEIPVAMKVRIARALSTRVDELFSPIGGGMEP